MVRCKKSAAYIVYPIKLSLGNISDFFYWQLMIYMKDVRTGGWRGAGMA